MALNIDLAPTLLDILGIPVPEEMQGVSLAPVLRDPDAGTRDSFLYEHFPVFPIPVPGMTAVRTDHHKLIRYHNDVRPAEFYDLAKDPGETRNIFGKPEYRALLAEMEAALERIKRETGYQYYTRG